MEAIMNMRPATVKLFIPSGEPQGLRTAEISNWTGKGVAAPRSEFDLFLKRDELKNAGVYILIGTDVDTDDPKLYIGEAEVVGKRVKDHRSKEFWVQIVAFVSKDENLTKSHVKYLEGKLIDRATEIGKAGVDNEQSSGAHLPESDQADMDVFLEKIYQLLPVLGTELFTLISAGPASHPTKRFQCKIKGITATGARSANGFMVRKDSQAILTDRLSIPPTIKSLRKQLMAKGVLQNSGDHLVFPKDHEFNSPSQAAAVIFAGSANGLTAWKNASGKALKDVESK